MNDSRLLLQEFHTLLTEYGEKLSMTTDMYRKSLIRRIETELSTPRPEAGATAYENLRQRCLKLGNFHPETKGSIGDIWAEIYKHRTLRQPAAELAVGYLSEFIDNYFADTSKPQERE